MNNQAAQTMPELPEPSTRWKGDGLFNSEQMRAMYQQGYAAALSQTAGLDLEQFRDVVNHYLSYYRGSLRLAEDSLSPITCGVNDLFQRRIDKATRLLALIDAQAAAPAASGGEYPECSGDPASCPENEGHGCCKPNPKCSCPSGDGSLDWPCKAHPQPAASEPYAKANPLGGPATMFDAIANRLRAGEPMAGVLEDYGLRFVGTAGASVSERAREVLAQTYEANAQPTQARLTREDSMTMIHFETAIRAIEQALTQQRGEPNGKLVGWWNGIMPDVTERSPYGPSVRWGADSENSGHDIPLYDGYNPIHYTTPQPGAEALRELVQSWRFMSDPYHGKCADELESLLGRGA